jgi:hypothetical protein
MGELLGVKDRRIPLRSNSFRAPYRLPVFAREPFFVSIRKKSFRAIYYDKTLAGDILEKLGNFPSVENFKNILQQSLSCKKDILKKIVRNTTMTIIHPYELNSTYKYLTLDICKSKNSEYYSVKIYLLINRKLTVKLDPYLNKTPVHTPCKMDATKSATQSAEQKKVDDIEMTSSPRNPIQPQYFELAKLIDHKYVDAEKKRLETIMEEESIFSSITLVTLACYSYLKIGVTSEKDYNTLKANPALKAFSTWKETKEELSSRTIYVRGVPSSMSVSHLDALIKRIVGNEIISISIPKSKSNDSRVTAEVILANGEAKELLLKKNIKSWENRLIFFNDEPNSSNRTWVLTGFPKEHNEFNIMAFCYQSGYENIINLQLAPNGRSAYVQFTDDVEPLKKDNSPLIWKQKGTPTCNECLRALPDHDKQCRHHHANARFVPKPDITMSKPTKPSSKTPMRDTEKKDKPSIPLKKQQKLIKKRKRQD